MVHSFRATVAEARRHGDLYFAALLPQDRMSQSRPFVPRWRGSAHRLARGPGALAVLGRHRSLLYGAKRFAGRSRSRIGARHRPAGRGGIARHLALARTQGSRGGRIHHHHARYAGESSGVSTAQNSEARLRLSDRSNPGDLVALGRHGAGGGDRKIQGEAERRKQFVSRTLRCAGRRRRHPCRPLFQRLVRHCLATPARHRRRSPQASSSSDRLSHGRAVGQRRPLGFLDQTATTEMDVGRAVRHAARRVDVARGPHPSRPKGLSHTVARRGDDAARRGARRPSEFATSSTRICSVTI